MTDWTPENIERLRAGLEAGESFSQIARRIPYCTRNGAIGKAQRMGLSQPGAATMPRRTYPKSMAVAPARPVIKIAGNGATFTEALARLPRVAMVERYEAPGACTIEALGAHMCKWPIGDPRDDGFTFCGAHVPDGSYCDAHARRAYQPAAVKRRVDERLRIVPARRFASA